MADFPAGVGVFFGRDGVACQPRDAAGDEERQHAIAKLGKSAEITRFKGLGEISPDEFQHFIGPDIRLEPVMITKDAKVNDLLGFYMGKNTPNRQEFIIGNLKVEKDLVEAYKWATLAEQFGDKNGTQLKATISQALKPEQLRLAQKAAEDWTAARLAGKQ